MISSKLCYFPHKVACMLPAGNNWLGNNLILKEFIILSRGFRVGNGGLPVLMLSKKTPLLLPPSWVKKWRWACFFSFKCYLDPSVIFLVLTGALWAFLASFQFPHIARQKAVFFHLFVPQEAHLNNPCVPHVAHQSKQKRVTFQK